MGHDYVSELRSPKGLMFITQIIYESGEIWWNDIDMKTKEPEENPAQCKFIYHKSIWAGPEANPGLRSDRRCYSLPESWNGLTKYLNIMQIVQVDFLKLENITAIVRNMFIL
jgi:hypothetical protein